MCAELIMYANLISALDGTLFSWLDGYFQPYDSISWM